MCIFNGNGILLMYVIVYILNDKTWKCILCFRYTSPCPTLSHSQQQQQQQHEGAFSGDNVIRKYTLDSDKIEHYIMR